MANDVPRALDRHGERPEVVLRARRRSPFTFNVAYADDKNIAIVLGRRLPIRDKRVDPRLPTKGTGKYEWKGFLPVANATRSSATRRGALVNWNNKPGQDSARPTTSGPTGRSTACRCCKAGIDAKPTHDLASVSAR